MFREFEYLTLSRNISSGEVSVEEIKDDLALRCGLIDALDWLTVYGDFRMPLLEQPKPIHKLPLGYTRPVTGDVTIFLARNGTMFERLVHGEGDGPDEILGEASIRDYMVGYRLAVDKLEELPLVAITMSNNLVPVVSVSPNIS